VRASGLKSTAPWEKAGGVNIFLCAKESFIFRDIVRFELENNQSNHAKSRSTSVFQ